MKLCFDLSSVLWTCLRAGKDVEGQEVEFNGKRHWINSAAFGYERAVNSMVAALNDYGLTPIDSIIVQEGIGSKSPRLAIDPNYKARASGEKPPEEYVQFQLLRSMIVDLFSKLGAVVVVQDYAEGDDVLGWLALNTEEDMVIVTNDNDLSVLNGKNTHGAEVGVRVDGIIGTNKYGDFPFKYVTLYKSLIGDTSDNISGIPGFGKVKWAELWARFGATGCDLLIDLINKRSFDSLYDDSTKDKLVKRLFDGAVDCIRSYKLATIYPSWVDTMLNPVQWKPGMVHGEVKDERVRQWAATRTLVTADNWERFAGRAMPQIKARPWLALDIETSTPDESDDWLEAQGDPEGVDTIGSKLTGMSLTFGTNMQHTVYISVDHKDTNNVSSTVLRDFIAKVAEAGLLFVIHNTNFEGPVLFNEWGEAWKDNGYGGFLPNWMDTKFCASYVDENDKLGLKHLSKKWLGYDQVDYKTTTTLQGLPGTLPPGGRDKGQVKIVYAAPTAATASETGVTEVAEVFHMEDLRQYKMRELTAAHVFDYACDDTVTTAAFYSFSTLFMQLEHTAQVLRDVEIAASYLHASAFVKGARVDLAKLAELREEDGATAEAAKVVLNKFLIAKGWEGTICPVFTAPIAAADIKLAHLIVTGLPLETAVRTPSKLLHLVATEAFRQALEQAIAGDVSLLNKQVQQNFSGEPVLNLGSPKQLQKLMYETMALPVKVYNMPTEAMRARGQREGTPKTDNLAITYALLDCSPEIKEVLEALRTIKMVNTRFGLFYEPLPGFVHWKTGRVHSSHNQCATNTRRASSSKPNLQQLSKNEKIEGFSPRVRELYIPHKKDAVIVSFDFSSQELVLAAHWSGDVALTSCFVGENLTDMHSKTGVGVSNNLMETSYSYEEFVQALESTDDLKKKRAKKARALGKAVNFGGLFRIAAKKLSTMLLVTETEAQAMIDAKAQAFPELEAWSLAEMEAVKGTGKVRTVSGAVRHLREAIMSVDRMVSSKAPRQVLSYRIQGSAAEQTKLAEGRMFSEKILEIYDCEYIAAIHDECVWSVTLDSILAFIPHVYSLMTQKYSTMQMPVRSSISVGWNFGEQKELNGDFSKENIEKALGIQLSNFTKETV